jgi:NADP-dependent 3-hydroxy acid dehydrogenase YdfG
MAGKVALITGGSSGIGRSASASSRLKKGVANFGGYWEASGHKEVFHEQEVRCAFVG